MAIMYKLRENMAGILIFLLVMFVASMTVGGLVGGANIMDFITGEKKADTILIVNDEEIPYKQFSRALEAELESFKQKNDKEPQGYQRQQIEDRVWNSFIEDILKRQQIEKLEINVTNDEISYFIFTNPHPIFRMDQNFWDDNNEFDAAKFHAALNSPGNDQFWEYKEQYLRLYVLPYEKLNYEIMSTVRVTNEELSEEYERKNRKVKISYVLFEPDKYDVPDDQISDEEIKAYYEEHLDDFNEEEKRKICFILFSTSPSAKDSLNNRALAQSLLDSAKSKADFAELAEIYSDDLGSAAKGGNLGFFGKGAMVKPFEEAAFLANVGDVVGPVKSNFGLHIIKIEDKKIENGEEQVKASHILLKFKASRETQETARDNADYFLELAKNEGFAQAADAEKLEVDTTDFFTNSGFIPKLGMQKRIALSAFEQEAGKISRVYFIENKGYVICQIVQIKKEGTKPLDEVRSVILNKVRREKQMKMAGETTRTFREKINLPEDLERVASEDSIEIKETDFFALEENIRGIGRDAKFNGTAFALDEKEISGPIEGSRGYYVIRVEEKQPFDKKAYEAQKSSLKNQLLENERRSMYTEWLSSLKEQADIKDYRYMFF